MTHKIKSTENLGSHQWYLLVELFPSTKEEIDAIHNSDNTNASDAERELIDIYLSLYIPGYSIIELIGQKGAIFKLKAFRN